MSRIKHENKNILMEVTFCDVFKMCELLRPLGFELVFSCIICQILRTKELEEPFILLWVWSFCFHDISYTYLFYRHYSYKCYHITTHNQNNRPPDYYTLISGWMNMYIKFVHQEVIFHCFSVHSSQLLRCTEYTT